MEGARVFWVSAVSHGCVVLGMLVVAPVQAPARRPAVIVPPAPTVQPVLRLPSAAPVPDAELEERRALAARERAETRHLRSELETVRPEAA